MDFLSFINQTKPVIFDGAMGTQLARHGLELNGGVHNLSHPDIVLKVHQNYVENGAHVVIANTFTMNPIYLKTHNMDINMEKVNQLGAEIAKKAGGLYVLGDMGPTGQLMEPFGSYTEQDMIDCYKAQAKVLAESGVDGFIIETMMDLKEALCALKACKAVSSLPVVVSFTMTSKAGGGKTMMGQTLAECAEAVEKEGGAVIGTNCGELDPEEIAGIVAQLYGKTSLPILVMPNAGKPKLVKGETVYNMTPEEFAQGTMKCIKAGASLVGGCCGTSPEHIRELAKLAKR